MDDKEISFGALLAQLAKVYFCSAQSQRDGVDERVFKVRLGGALSSLI